MVSLTSRPWSIAPCAALGPIEQPGRRSNQGPRGQGPRPQRESRERRPKDHNRVRWLCHLSYRWPKRALPAVGVPRMAPKALPSQRQWSMRSPYAEAFDYSRRRKISPMFSMSPSDCRSAQMFRPCWSATSVPGPLSALVGTMTAHLDEPTSSACVRKDANSHSISLGVIDTARARTLNTAFAGAGS